MIFISQQNWYSSETLYNTLLVTAICQLSFHQYVAYTAID